MTSALWEIPLEYLIFVIVLIPLAYLFGRIFYRVYKGERPLGTKLFLVLENKVYSWMGIDPREEMTPKQFLLHLSVFSAVSFIFLFLLLLFQGFFILNPNEAPNMRWDLALNSAISFITNTNWQAYAGEKQASYLAQTIGFTVQNFISGAVGISVLFVLLRGFSRKEWKTIGNFWSDLFGISLVMLPVSFITALLLVSQGVPQTFSGSIGYYSLEGTRTLLSLGPVASQVAIKQLFTNGGGFFGTNSAYPFENPTPFSNLIESISIILIPVSLCFTFGRAVFDKKQGITLLSAMGIIFVFALVGNVVAEYMTQNMPLGISGLGNMEGKEVRFGIGDSALWASLTASSSNGSVNSMLDSFTPLGGMIPLILILLGEVIFGGVGTGLFGMIAFAIFSVFIAGLMVGRTPEYIGKKLGVFEMKMACLIILPSIILVLFGTAATVLLPDAKSYALNNGPHSFTEILYAFASMANNNGSSFGGFAANTVWANVIGALVMGISRFVPIVAVVLLSGSLANKKMTPVTEGTLSTTSPLFLGFLVSVILIIGALSFYPVIALGPIAEFLA